MHHGQVVDMLSQRELAGLSEAIVASTEQNVMELTFIVIMVTDMDPYARNKECRQNTAADTKAPAMRC